MKGLLKTAKAFLAAYDADYEPNYTKRFEAAVSNLRAEVKAQERKLRQAEAIAQRTQSTQRFG